MVTAEVIANAFVESNVKLPGIVKPGQNNIPVKWVFDKLTKDVIRSVQPACGCTAAVSITDEGIEAMYNDNHNPNIKYGNDGFFSKSLTVYFKTEESAHQDTMIRNAKGAEIQNPLVPSMLIHFNGTLDIAK